MLTLEHKEQALVFDCAGTPLVGILHPSEKPTARGVLLLVGGPQYRVGSHRQFVLLARFLAAEGIPVLRFDYRGMGDSGGTELTFEEIAPDIRAAIDAFFTHAAGLKEIVLWGLCDGASAALLCGTGDTRVTGLVLLNPWVRTAGGQARTQLRHYYLARIRDRAAWERLMCGRINLFTSLLSMGKTLLTAVGIRCRAVTDLPSAVPAKSSEPFPLRMAQALQIFPGRVLLILSGADLTAAEFKDFIAASRPWRRALAQATITRRDLEQANHTFSCRAWRDQVARWTTEWVKSW